MCCARLRYENKNHKHGIISFKTSKDLMDRRFLEKKKKGKRKKDKKQKRKNGNEKEERKIKKKQAKIDVDLRKI